MLANGTSLISLLLSIWKKCLQGPGCSFVLILQVANFVAKHSRLYRNSLIYPQMDTSHPNTL